MIYVKYKLKDGEQPYQTVADNGASFNGGLAVFGEWYIGTVEGTNPEYAIEHCQDFQMSVIDLDMRKSMIISEASQLSFDKRNEVLPDYKLINAGLGIYSETEKQNIVSKVQAYRNEYYRIKSLIDNATTLAECEAVVFGFDGI